MELSTIIGALLVLTVVALVALTYTRRIDITGELPFFRLVVKAESGDASNNGPSEHQPQQIQVQADDSTQEMPGSARGKQEQRRTRGSSQKIT